MKDTLKICEVCGEGRLHSQVEKNTVEYKGRSTQLDSHYSVCDCCGSEQAATNETRQNKRAMIAFKKQVDGLLTGAEIRAIRKEFGITQAQAANIFGGGPVAFSKYEADDVMQSEPMDKLLRLVAAIPPALAWLANRAGEKEITRRAIWESFTTLRRVNKRQFAQADDFKGFNPSPRASGEFRFAVPAANDGVQDLQEGLAL